VCLANAFGHRSNTSIVSYHLFGPGTVLFTCPRSIAATAARVKAVEMKQELRGQCTHAHQTLRDRRGSGSSTTGHTFGAAPEAPPWSRELPPQNLPAQLPLSAPASTSASVASSVGGSVTGSNAQVPPRVGSMLPFARAPAVIKPGSTPLFGTGVSRTNSFEQPGVSHTKSFEQPTNEACRTRASSAASKGHGDAAVGSSSWATFELPPGSCCSAACGATAAFGSPNSFRSLSDSSDADSMTRSFPSNLAAKGWTPGARTGGVLKGRRTTT